MHAWAKRLAQAVLPDHLYAKLKTAYAVRSFPPQVVEREYGGFRFRMSLEDPLAAQWYGGGWPEPKEVAVLRAHGLAPGSRVFDLGAHQGLVAMMLARVVGEAGRVIAVEPGRHNVEVCRRNLALNAIENVETVWAAVSDAPGEVSFPETFCGSIARGGGWVGAKVPAVTIDGLARRYGAPDAVLIDVEGAEALALAGASQTIARGALFVVEIHAGCGLEELGAEPADVLAAFHGYRLLVSPGDGPGDWRAPSGTITERAFLFASR